MRTIFATLKMLAFALTTLALIPMQLLVLQFTKGPVAYILPHYWGKAVCRIFNITVLVRKKPEKNHQCIFISNHLSYLDIPAISSIITASFVAKKDVASWPVFGFLSKLQQTAYISRDRADATKGKQTLETMLAERKSLIIFPEGTSTDGRDVRPFKSSLFSIALNNSADNLYIQPFTIKMETVDKRPIKTQQDRDIYAWHIDMDTPLAEHLWAFASSQGATISLTFHDAFPAKTHPDRKILAKHCHNTVSNGLQNKDINSKGE